MAAQPGAIPPIHPQRIPNGYLLTSSAEVQARTPDPSQAAFHPAHLTLYSTPVNAKTDIEQRADLQVFVYNDVGINSLRTEIVYARNGNQDWVASDPDSPYRATPAAGNARARALVGSRLSRAKERSFRVFKAIVPQIVALFGTPQEWQNATTHERMAVFNTIYSADEYSIASATVGNLMCATVNFDAIFLNNAYFPSNYPNINIIPVLRNWCRYSFINTCEIVFRWYVVNPGTPLHQTIARTEWSYLWAYFLRDYGWYRGYLPVDIMIPGNMPIRG
jgi:hypothetical protein